MSSHVAAALSALRHRFVSQLVHQPKLLRVFASALRKWPEFNRAAQMAARRTAVLSVLHRQASFSNAAQAPNLVAGEFAIGMEAGERHQQDREFLQSVLSPPNQWARLSADKVGELIQTLRHSEARSFDLVNDYLVHVAWRALASAFGPAANAIIPMHEPAG